MIATPTDTMGIPEAITPTGTSRITLGMGTAPPRVQGNVQAQMQTQPPGAAPPSPATWPEFIDLAGRAAASGVRQWMHESKTEPAGGAPSPRGSLVPVLALTMSIVNVIALAAAIVGHQLGNSSFEVEMAAQRQAIYALIDVLAEKNPEVRSAERHLQR
jgi:hypothetical protein